MSQPLHWMATDPTAALRDVGPFGVLSQPKKNTGGTLVCTGGQHDFVAFAELGNSRDGAHHVEISPCKNQRKGRRNRLPYRPPTLSGCDGRTNFGADHFARNH